MLFCGTTVVQLKKGAAKMSRIKGTSKKEKKGR